MVLYCMMRLIYVYFFFFQAEDGIRDLVRSRGLGDVYKRQPWVGEPGGLAYQDDGRRPPTSTPPRLTLRAGHDLSLIHI